MTIFMNKLLIIFFLFKINIEFQESKFYGIWDAEKFCPRNENGDFIGGAIAPGIKTSAEYLISKAALLNDIDLKFPKNIIGKDTKENIQSGIMYGAIDQVEGMIKRINNETKINNHIILTGGFSKLLSPKLKINHTLDMDLTLKGMIFIYESNN